MIEKESKETYRTHDGCLPVELLQERNVSEVIPTLSRAITRDRVLVGDVMQPWWRLSGVVVELMRGMTYQILTNGTSGA